MIVVLVNTFCNGNEFTVGTFIDDVKYLRGKGSGGVYY